MGELLTLTAGGGPKDDLGPLRRSEVLFSWLRAFASFSGSPSNAESPMAAGPVIEITYCRLCGWGLRAGWMAQELLTTFAEEVGSVMLTPDASGGVFDVRVDGAIVWSRKEWGRFPESKELKQLVRDRIAPGRALGHSDSP
jgi:selenoprotein W-related protein